MKGRGLHKQLSGFARESHLDNYKDSGNLSKTVSKLEKKKQNRNTSQFQSRVIKSGKLMMYLVQSWRPLKQVVSLSVSKLEEKEHGVLIHGNKGESYYCSITEIINSYFLYCIASLSSQLIWWKYLNWWHMTEILSQAI